jgi:ergothioneine biosynthesis protein EgtB
MTKLPRPDSPHAVERSHVIATPDIAALLARFHQVRAKTEVLAAPIPAEEAGLQSMPDASPLKWHLAHTSWFFETFLLEPFEVGFQPFHTDFKVLFNSYYNGVGDKHPRAERGLIGRPNLAEILAYRDNVTKRITNLLQTISSENQNVIDLMWLGCNHEEQHQELILTDVKHLLSKNPSKPAYQPRWPLTTVKARRATWIQAAGGLIEIGHDADHAAHFAFDNESPRHKVWLEPFELASQPVTHGEFLAFVEAGGYTQPEWWLSMGWDWVCGNNSGNNGANKITAPMYWEKHASGWRTFTLHGMVPIEPNTPICHISKRS